MPDTPEIPRVFRSPLIHELVVAGGWCFTDGKRRVIVHAEATDAQIDVLTEALELADAADARLDRAIKAVRIANTLGVRRA